MYSSIWCTRSDFKLVRFRQALLEVRLQPDAVTIPADEMPQQGHAVARENVKVERASAILAADDRIGGKFGFG